MPVLVALTLDPTFALLKCNMSLLSRVPLQQLSNENRQQAKRNAGREDMKWKVNVEVHDPEIGLVSALSCHRTGSPVGLWRRCILLDQFLCCQS